ncbi:GPR1/FUN34/yaaH family domain-containing protein [Trichoderma compactum]
MAGNSDQIECVRTNTSVAISIEVFERRYLAPQLPKADWYKRLGNPTPLGPVGLPTGATPLACTLMGWEGGGGVATIGFTYFFGGLLQLIASVLEFILRNTFPFVVFGSFGAFWVGFGATQTPSFDAQGVFQSGQDNTDISEFYASYAFGLIFTAVLVARYTICATRLNVVFVCLFFTLTLAFDLLLWGVKYLLHPTVLGPMLDAVNFPLRVPVGDLTGRLAREKASSEADSV